MTHFATRMLAALAAAGTLAVAAPASADHHMESKTIVETAVGNDDFSTLVAAVQAADLAGTLSGEGPFTVFAPTDAAFAALPDGTVEGLLEPAARDTLARVLTYHVVAGEVMAADLLAMIEDNGGALEIETLAGGTLTARVTGGNVVLTDAAGRTATVTATDVDASNGVIHVLDSVLLPG